MKKSYFISTIFCLFIGLTCTANAQTTFSRNLSIGSSGGDVIQLQNFLVFSGFLTMPLGSTEGYFGNLTKQALIQYQLSKGIQPASGFLGPITQAQIMRDGKALTSNTAAAAGTVAPLACPTGYSCATATTTSLSITRSSVGYPANTIGNSFTSGVSNEGIVAATWLFSFTILSTSSLPVYISATPRSAVQISTDLPGIPGVSGLAYGTMPIKIMPTGLMLQGDTGYGLGTTATGSYIIPPNSSRTFTVSVVENNSANPGSDGSASVSITGIYYGSSPTPSGVVTPVNSEALFSLGSNSLTGGTITLQGGNEIFPVLPPAQ